MDYFEIASYLAYVFVFAFFGTLAAIVYYVMKEAKQCRICNRNAAFENISPSARAEGEYICSSCKLKEE